MKILSNKCVYSSTVLDYKRHNAFTDLKFYKGYYYLAFRNGTAHLSKEGDGQVIVLRSKDCKAWEKMSFPAINGDVRDCKFGETDGLFLLVPYRCKRMWWWKFGTIRVDFGEKTQQWGEPYNLVDDWIAWRPKVIDKTLYVPVFWHGSGMDNFNNWKAGIMTEDDVEIVYGGKAANEMEVFEHDEKVYGILRREGHNAVLVCIKGGNSVYEFNKIIQSPVVYPLTKDKFLVVGRHIAWEADFRSVFMPDNVVASAEFREILEFHVLDMRNKSFNRVGTITANAKRNDCGYAGIAKKGKNLLVSFYSGFHNAADIYIAEIEIEPEDLDGNNI